MIHDGKLVILGVISLFSLTLFRVGVCQGFPKCITLGDAAPCTCRQVSQGSAELDCSAVESGDQLLTIPALQDNPTAIEFYGIIIGNNAKITEVPESAFGPHTVDATFKIFNNPKLTKIHPSIFKSAYSRVSLINLSNNSLTSFPFEEVFSNFSADWVFLHGNMIEAVPTPTSPWEITMTQLTLSDNQISFIGANAFAGVSSNSADADVDLSNNELTRLGKESLVLAPDFSGSLTLRGNKIWDFEPGFTNVLPPGLDLSDNIMEGLEEATWRPLLESALQMEPLPWVILTGNNIQCNCRIYWLYQNKEFEPLFRGTLTCADDDHVELWQHEESFFNCG